MKQEGTKDIEGQLWGIPNGGISIIRHSKAEGECTLLTEQFQGKKYGEDTKRKFPNYHVRTYVVYICANKGWKCWEVQIPQGLHFTIK